MREDSRVQDARAKSDRRAPQQGPPAQHLALRDLFGLLGPRPSGAAMQERLLALRIEPGRWIPPAMLERDSTALLVISGALLRTRLVDGQRASDLLLTRTAERMECPASVRWTVVSSVAAHVAILTPSTLAALAAVPGASATLFRMLLDRRALDLELRLIVGIQRVEVRIVRFFEHLARQIGEPEGAMVRIPLMIAQRRIEEILSAGHTQATSAFRSLFAAGVLTHDARGWLFAPTAWRSPAVAPSCSVPNSVDHIRSAEPDSMERLATDSLVIQRPPP